jgi:DNA-directed RNA polymerase specialized sigma24 family protein
MNFFFRISIPPTTWRAGWCALATTEDVVHEAYLRAFQYSGGLRGGDARAWLLTIALNVAYSWLRTMRASEPVDQFRRRNTFRRRSDLES